MEDYRQEKATKQDMEYAYKYLLDRLPENDTVTEPDGQKFWEIRNRFIMSPEFQSKRNAFPIIKYEKSGEVFNQNNGISPRDVSLPPPPNTIPEKFFDEITMKGKIPVLYSYADNRVLDNTPVHNSRDDYESVFRQLDNKTFSYYGNEINAFYDALHKYSFKEKTVIIWGLAGCNCEALAVWNGAEKVYVVDYNKPVCDNDKIEVFNHEEIGSKKIKADYAISYSSFEHDGLGRYGDPISPNGDIRAMREAHDFLKDDGIIFLGVPLGQDCLCWNMHRIYGKERLPLLLKGWQCIDVFDANDINTVNYPFDLPLGQYIQCVLVCKKIVKDYPDDSFLTKKDESDMLNRINKIMYDHKKNKSFGGFFELVNFSV